MCRKNKQWKYKCWRMCRWQVFHEGIQHENIILSFLLMWSKFINLLGQPVGVNKCVLFFQIRKWNSDFKEVTGLQVMSIASQTWILSTVCFSINRKLCFDSLFFSVMRLCLSLWHSTEDQILYKSRNIIQ